MNDLTRRNFIRAATAVSAASCGRILGANDRVRMGYVGLGNRGDQVHDAFLEFSDAPTVAICDLREDYLDLAAKKSRAAPTRYKEYRKLLDDKDVDAVVIATPDHWHALMFIDACNAGKDVYVEKPLSLTVHEGRRMVETAEKTKRVVQVGLQRRSNKAIQEAAEFVRSGGIGHVSVAKGFHLYNEWPNGIGNVADGPAPSEEMWDKWLGPAPKVPYNGNRTFYRFRWFITTPADRSPTSEFITSIRCGHVWGRTLQKPSPRSAATTSIKITARSRTRRKFSGSIPGRP